MTRKCATLSFLLFSLIAGYSPAQNITGDTSLVIMTYNIRFKNPADSMNAWPLRKDKLIRQIMEQQPAIFGLQEALTGQILDILQQMPSFAWVGVGRDDGKEAGEYTPIFYHTGRLTLKQSSTFWLSPTPKVPGSKGWDAACNRIVTWAEFTDKNTGKAFFVFNTHFDHMGVLARRNSTFLLMQAMDSLAGKLPVILTGDFNVPPNSDPIRILTARSKPWLLVQDTRSLTNNRFGPQISYVGFEVGKLPGELIDFIFVKHIRQVSWHKILDANDGKYYPSDHLPVVVKLSFAS